MPDGIVTKVYRLHTADIHGYIVGSNDEDTALFIADPRRGVYKASETEGLHDTSSLHQVGEIGKNFEIINNFLIHVSEYCDYLPTKIQEFRTNPPVIE